MDDEMAHEFSQKHKKERKEGKAAEQKTATCSKAPAKSKSENDDEEFMNPSEMLDVGS